MELPTRRQNVNCGRSPLSHPVNFHRNPQRDRLTPSIFLTQFKQFKSFVIDMYVAFPEAWGSPRAFCTTVMC